MNVVIDTNILLISLPSLSPYHEIIKAFNRKLFQLVVTTAIFLEYEEILSKRSNRVIANNTLAAFRQASNVVFVNTYFHWNLLFVDPDDNKFIDAYISGNADYLVTHDSHFNILQEKRFPKRKYNYC